MSKLNRFFDLASKAIDKASSSSTPQNADGQRGDWTSIVRNAAGTFTGRGGGTPAAQPGHSPSGAWPPSPSGYGASPPVDSSPSLQPPPAGQSTLPRRSPGLAPPTPGADGPDRAAVARYEYLLRTADPAQVEHIHHDAFARLTPAQRDELDARLRAELPPHEHPRSSGAADLARAATRAEVTRPGMLTGLLARAGRQRSPGGRGALVGAGAGAAGGLLVAVAGGAVISSVAAPLLADAIAMGVDFDALAGAVEIDGLTAGVGDVAAGAGDAVSGVTDHVTALGEQLSNFQVPGIGDWFGR